MEQVNPYESNNQRLKNKKDAKKSKILSALGIGFLAGIMMFGIISAIYSENYLIIFPMLFPIYFIYKALVKSKKKFLN